jgi:hypothetical protein
MQFRAFLTGSVGRLQRLIRYPKHERLLKPVCLANIRID